MTIAAVGDLSLVQENLRNTLADSTAFRNWLGVTTQEQARNRIHEDAMEPGLFQGKTFTLEELEGMRPYALIWTDEEDGYETRLVGAPAAFDSAGSLTIRLVEDVPATLIKQPGEAMRRFRNTIGQIIADLQTLRGQDGYLLITGLSVDGPHRNNPAVKETQGDHQVVEITVEY